MEQNTYAFFSSIDNCSTVTHDTGNSSYNIEISIEVNNLFYIPIVFYSSFSTPQLFEHSFYVKKLKKDILYLETLQMRMVAAKLKFLI